MDTQIYATGKKTSNEDFLFCPEILSKLNYKKTHVKFDPLITALSPGEDLFVRPLHINDYDKGYLELLSQLTITGNVSEEKFKEKFLIMKSCKNHYFVTVVEDTITNQIVGSATLAVEEKFIHSAGIRGRLEDVVISADYRGRQLGKLMVSTITLLADYLGCYKITLDCKDKMIRFYQQFGFICESGNNNMMSLRFKD